MYRWTPEMIRFLEDAAQKTEYYEQLAARLAALLPGGACLCDVGCGLGHLAQALCPRFAQVTALDHSAEAIDAFRRRLGTNCPDNLHICCADAFALPQTLRFDAMIFCYFGSLPEILRVARRHCTGKTVIIRRDEALHRFDLDGHPRTRAGAADTLATLKAQGIHCTAERLTVEFGQPFRSMEDALRFFRLYRRDPQRTVDVSDVAPKLIETQNAEFPLYYPQPKRIAILSFETSQTAM